MSKPELTKTAKVRAMLQRPNGATIEAICDLTGWQPHSARAALSGLRKAGHQIERVRQAGGGSDGSGASVYRIVADNETQA